MPKTKQRQKQKTKNRVKFTHHPDGGFKKYWLMSQTHHIAYYLIVRTKQSNINFSS
jgi:hypothetical protein